MNPYHPKTYPVRNHAALLRPDEDRIDYVTRENEIFEQSDFKSISNDYFKCLSDLWDSSYADVHVRILTMIEKNLDIILLDLDDECQRMATVLDDTAVIQQKVREHVVGRNLNGALEDSHRSLLSAKDIFATLKGGSCFAKMELPETYLQFKVESERREYLTSGELNVCLNILPIMVSISMRVLLDIRIIPCLFFDSPS
ncbi:hypothetical protein ACTXT7_008250 [Hymenolepis weldensis]